MVDLHADSFLCVRATGKDILQRHRPPLLWNPLKLHVDLPRLREGGVSLQVFGLPAVRALGRDFNAQMESQIRLAEAAVERADGALVVVHSPEDVVAAQQASAVGIAFGLEGCHPLKGDITEELTALQARGLALVGLVHLKANRYAASTGGREPKAAGLTDLGHEVISACNELGLVVDLAHAHRKSFFEAVAQSQAPVMVSHAGCAAVSAHHRNLDDEQLKALAAAGGVMGIIFHPWYLKRFGLLGSVKMVAAHVEHAVKVMGADHVAYGSDFDGYIWAPRGLPDVASLPRLTAELLRRGMREDQVRRIVGENVLRCWGEVRKAAGH